MGFLDALALADAAVRALLDGRSVTYSPGSGGPVVVSGVFDAAYVNADAGKAGVMSSGPAVFLRLSDLPSDPSADTAATVTFNSVIYAAHEVQPDGLGGVHLLLHETT